jgi:hypothetical protein
MLCKDCDTYHRDGECPLDRKANRKVKPRVSKCDCRESMAQRYWCSKPWQVRLGTGSVMGFRTWAEAIEFARRMGEP